MSSNSCEMARPAQLGAIRFEVDRLLSVYGFEVCTIAPKENSMTTQLYGAFAMKSTRLVHPTPHTIMPTIDLAVNLAPPQIIPWRISIFYELQDFEASRLVVLYGDVTGTGNCPIRGTVETADGWPIPISSSQANLVIEDLDTIRLASGY